MTVAHRTLALIICMGLSACGNHREAPVVYGASQSHSARIYNSPEEIYRKQQAERARAIEANAAPSRMTATPVSARSAPAPLKPVSAVYLDDGAAASSAAPRAKAKGYIEVQPGDTVYAIGRRFNVSPAAIIDENDLRAPYALTIGQALKLPKGASTARKVVARDTLYSVRQGDTLYSISRASNVSVNAIAQANALRPPYSLAVGQRIAIPQAPTNSALYARANGSSSKPAASKIDNTAAAPRNVGELARQASYAPPPAAAKTKSMFAWPVRGAVIAEYGSGDVGRRNDGVNIAAPAGTPVRAAADGEVVYRGSELDGFGNLLLVKHTDGFVTAYAHNDAMLVKKGDKVRQGQVIAKVGESGAVTSPQLHFEIRQNLKSVDPIALLGAQ